MIVILSNELDFHAVAVRWALSQLRENCRIITSLYECLDSVSMRISNEGITSSFTPDVVWWRRPTVNDVHTNAMVEFRQFMKREWRSFTYGALSQLPIDTFFVNDPVSARRAELKQPQLQNALQAGLQVPLTLISNDYDEILRFIETNKAKGKSTIVKHFTPHVWRQPDGSVTIVGTSKITAADLGRAGRQSVKATAGIFQEYIKPSYEVRATVIGDRIFPLRITAKRTKDSLPPGVWKERLSADFSAEFASSLPKHIDDSIRHMVNTLNLKYAAIDLIFDDNGVCYFLELNQSGQFLFCESVCPRMHLLATFAALLASKTCNVDETQIDRSITLSKFMQSTEYRGMRFRALRGDDAISERDAGFLTSLGSAS